MVERQPIHERPKDISSRDLRLSAGLLKVSLLEGESLGEMPSNLTEEETYDRLTCLYHR